MAEVTYELTIWEGSDKPKIRIPAVTKVIVRRSIKKPSSIEIILPTFENLPSEVIKFGDKIVWKRGYDGENDTVFIGYVTSINDSQPYTIQGKDILFFIYRNTTTIPTYLRGENISTIENFLKQILIDPSGKINLNIEWDLDKYVFINKNFILGGGSPSYKFFFDKIREFTYPAVNYYIKYDENDNEILYFYEDLNFTEIPTYTISDNNIIEKSLNLKKVVEKKVRVFVYEVDQDPDSLRYNHNVTVYPPRGFNYILRRNNIDPYKYEIVNVKTHEVVETTADSVNKVSKKSTNKYSKSYTDSDVERIRKEYNKTRKTDNFGNDVIFQQGFLDFSLLEEEVHEFYLKVSDIDKIKKDIGSTFQSPSGTFARDEYAKDRWKKLILFNGLIGGDFTIFGRPTLSPGDKINIILFRTEEYYFGQYVESIEDVTHKGIKQKIKLRERDKNEFAK